MIRSNNNNQRGHGKRTKVILLTKVKSFFYRKIAGIIHQIVY